MSRWPSFRAMDGGSSTPVPPEDGNQATYAVVQVEDGRLSVEIKEL